MSSCPFSERASMPEEAGKHRCSGPGHGIDEMCINRHPKTHTCRPNQCGPNLHALQTHLLLLSQTTLCCCTSFSRKCGSFLPPPGSHLHFGAPRPQTPEATIFPSPSTSSTSTFTHRGTGAVNRGPTPLLRARLWPTSFQLTLAYHIYFIFGSSAAMELKS